MSTRRGDGETETTGVGDRRSRRDEYAEATRRALVLSAKEQFTELGYVSSSLDAIAESARVSKGAIYHHFSSKQALFEDVLIAVCGDVLEGIDLELEAASPQPVTLPQAFEAYLDAGLADNFRRLTLQEGPVALGWERWRVLMDEQVVSPFGALLRRRIGELAEGPQTGAMFLRAVVGALNELVLAVADSPDPGTARVEASQIVGDLGDAVRTIRFGALGGIG